VHQCADRVDTRDLPGHRHPAVALSRLHLGAGHEVELLVESLINNDGVLRGNNAIEYVPTESVLKLEIGDRIRLTADDFERLATAFFAELERTFR
jgi:hypothetical protein